MQLLDPISYDEVVAEWVKAEYASPFTQFAVAFDGPEAPASWAINPDVTNTEQNHMRAGVLSLLRPMVAGLPHDVLWWQARVDRAEFEDFLYMSGDDWAILSGGTRRIADGARLFTPNCHGLALRSAVVNIRRKVLAGKVLPEMIAISTPTLDPVVIIEGHKRATAYLFGRKPVVQVIDLIIGVSPNMPQFEYW